MNNSLDNTWLHWADTKLAILIQYVDTLGKSDPRKEFIKKNLQESLSLIKSTIKTSEEEKAKALESMELPDECF